MDAVEKLIIIGSGPAGLTSAIYSSRGNLNPLVISGREAGGQLVLTTDVDDFPGFEKGIQGPELMEKMRKQAERFQTRFINEDVLSLDLAAYPFVVNTESQTFKSYSLIVATGASAQWLNIPSEMKFRGRGVSACAVCDGLFFKGKKVMVIGGGDTAMREAQHLSKVASQVTVVHRRDQLRAQAALVELVKSKVNVDFLLNSTVEEYLGEERLSGVLIKNSQTGQVQKVPIEGVFVAIGHKPNTGFLSGQLELDDQGYLVVKNHTQTSVKGVFAAGDISDHRYRQGVTAAGAGCMAALDAEEFLEHLQYNQSNERSETTGSAK